MAEAAVDPEDCPLCLLKCEEPVTLSCEHRFCSLCLTEHWARGHNGVCPECKSFSAPLKAKKQHITDIMKQYNSMLEHAEGQMVHCETQIMQQFKWFQQFLVQEEMLCLSALRKQHQEKTRIIEEELKKLEDKLVSLSDSMCSAEQQLQGPSTQSCPLSEHKESHVLTEEPEPQLRSGLLLDTATVLGNLGFRVWKKMETIVKYSPVILDPNTAHRELRLSEDLTRVHHGDTLHHVPLNPERFMTSPSVLGSEGFSSGRHRWEVEVGDHPAWTIGVVKESMSRRITQHRALPTWRSGFCCLTYCNGTYSGIRGDEVAVERHPKTICVDLDCFMKRVSFYDTGSMTLICTHSDTFTFTEKMYPFFSVGKADDANVANDIKIRPFQIRVSQASQQNKAPSKIV